ncbi:MAG: hypothetical protein ABTD50_16435 [Polyangiaceae bacterium]|jgi:hypothetical protein
MTACACEIRARRSLEDKEQRLRETRDKLAVLRSHLKELRERRRSALALASERCRAERLAVRQRVAEVRAAARDERKRALFTERAAAREARGACALRRGNVRRELGEGIDHAQFELDTERKDLAELRRIERGNRERAREGPQIKRAERQSESDDFVRQNIPPELLPLWERVKRGIKATPRMSRSEAFMHYAEEHPEEVIGIIEDRTEALIRELEAKERAAARELRQVSRRSEPRESEVPF